MAEKQLEELILSSKEKLDKVSEELKKEITGQNTTVRKLLIGLVSQGHILLEGMPGLAKTLLAKSLAGTLNLSFNRIQFTPDLLPSDLIGTVVFNPKNASFETRKGPIFTGILLADEINRAPAKVQSALLQCMGEKIVTIGETTYKLDTPFMVIATENPIEQEGTYQLPEAQMDRFLMKINVGYPSFQEELAILSQHGDSGEPDKGIQKILGANELLQIYNQANAIHIDEKLKDYIIRIVRNTRPETTSIEELKPYIKHGASPRASLALLRAGRAHALMEGRSFVTAEDIRSLVFDVFRHRLILTFEAISEDITVESLIKTIMESTELP
ncbi:MAG: MoxR family ATPase [Leptospiraceae bacterium]|nr:MoxR family ATPase [Leptospiraceae bacterium]MCP5502505.1 MoxR family ATPase [Leptospiraceae bacterium]